MRKPAPGTAKLLDPPAEAPPAATRRCATSLCQRCLCLACGRTNQRCLAAASFLALGLSVLLWLGAAGPPPSAPPRQQQPAGTRQRSQLRIPRVLHFTSHSEILHDEYRPMMQSWLDANPDFQFYLWRDADIACLVRLRYPAWLPAFNGSGLWLETPLERSDFTRILALYHFGGLYLDLDTKSVADVGHLFDQPLAGAMLATEPPEHATLLFGLDSLVSNAVMFSAPGHPFLATYIAAIEAIVKKKTRPGKRHNLNAPEITGPLVMQRAYETYRANEEVACSSLECRVHLFPPEVFSPVHDLCQTWNLKNICNATTLAELPEGKRNVCVKLWARNFTQAKFTYSTLGAHLFSHISTYPSKTPKFFNAKVAFPQLRFFADSTRGC